MQEMISTGVEELDQEIKGYPKDGITTIYGKASSGKTNLALICAKEMTKKTDKKILIINTEKEIMIERISQLIGKEQLNRFIFLNINTFQEQEKKIDWLTKQELSNISMILFDSANKKIRSEATQENKKIFKEQLNKLKQKTREKKIPLIMTAQVYSSYEKEEEEIFSGTIIKESSDCLIELNIIEKLRKLKLKKHTSIAGEKEIFFKIEKEKIKGFIPR